MNIWHPGSLCSVTAPPCSTNTTNPSTEIPPFLIINEDFWMHIHTYLHCGLIVANLGQNSVSPPFFLGWTSKTNFSHHEESLPMKKFTDQKKVDSRHSNPIGSNFSLPCTSVHAFLPCLQNCIYQKKKTILSLVEACLGPNNKYLILFTGGSYRHIFRPQNL